MVAHIPCIIIVYGTSNGPQSDIGNVVGSLRAVTAVTAEQPKGQVSSILFEDTMVPNIE